MDRSQAYETLKLHPSADGQMVSDAYWRQVRIAQSEGDTPEAQATIEQLNAAYAELNPKALPPGAPARGGALALQRVEGSGIWILDIIADWVTAQAQLTRQRWPGRNFEIGLIGGAALFMMLLALGAGASVLLTFAAAVAVLAGIWAPWRHPE